MLPLLQTHPLVSPHLVVGVWIVPTQALPKRHSGVHSDRGAPWVRESSIPAHGIRVPTCTIRLVTNRLGHGGCGGKLLGGNWRTVDIGQEGATLILLSWAVHRAETPIVVIDVAVPSATIDGVFHSHASFTRETAIA